MASAPVLASVRCLAALPVSSNSAELCIPMPGVADDGALEHDDSSGHIQPLRYQAFLQRKVQSALAAMRARFQAALVAEPTGLLPRQSAAAGSASQNRGVGLPPSVLAPGAQRAIAPAPLGRKRSAADAGLEPAGPSPVPHQPSSINLASSSLSDDGATPSAPAEQPLPAGACFAGAHDEQVVEQQPSLPGARPRGGGSVHQGAVRPRGTNAAGQQVGAQVQVGPQAGLAGNRLQPPLPPQGLRSSPAQLHRVPAKSIPPPPLPSVGPDHGHQGPQLAPGGLQPGVPGGGPAPPQLRPPSAPVLGPAPVYGGVLYAPLAAPNQRPPQLGPPQGTLTQPPLQPQVGTVPQAGGAAAPGSAADWERQRARGLCSLPAPSLALQKLMARQGAGTAPSGSARQPQVAPQPHAGDREKAQHPAQGSNVAAACAALACPHASLVAALSAADAGVRAAVQQTAAAAAARQQEQLSALPPFDTVLQRWPLDSLQARFGSGAGGEGAPCTASGTQVGAAGCTAGTAGLLRFLQTAHPRASTVSEVPRTWPGTAALPLSALAEPLPADKCQTRQDLWDLFLLYLQEQPAADPQRDLQGSLEGPALDSCPVWDEASGGNDDSDVYITDEGLTCLASLAEAPTSSATGWSLPFLVRPRQGQRQEGGGAGGPAALCADCEEPAAAAGGRGGRRAPPPVLYFAGPFWDSAGLALDSWSRLCARALAAAQLGRHGAGVTCGGDCADTSTVAGKCKLGGGATEGSEAETEEEEVKGEEEEEDCPHCQQDEWQLGGLSLLVLSHCRLGLRSACGGGGGDKAAPLHVVALAASAGGGGDGSQAGAAVAASAARALRSAEVACRAELLSAHASAMAVVVDPATGRLLGQHRADGGTIALLRQEHTGAAQSCWQVAHGLLMAMRRLPPGSYMLQLDASMHSLELRGR